MAARTENTFEMLSREEAAPEVEKPAAVVTQEDVKQGLAKKEAVGVAATPTSGGMPSQLQADAPPTPGSTGAMAEAPQPKAQPPIEPDVSKAPGPISYSEAAKEHGEAAEQRAGESVQAGKEATKEAAQATQAKAGEVKERAGAAAESAEERSAEAAEEVKERTAEIAQAAKEQAGELAESAKHTAAEGAQKAEELAGATQEKAAQAAEAAKEKAADVAQNVGDTVTSAVGYIKEHLPEVHLPEVHVERADTTPAERESQALMNEALALATGEPAPIRAPPREEAPARPAEAPATTGTAAAAPPEAAAGGSRGLGAVVEEPPSIPQEAPFRAYEPRTATEVIDRTDAMVEVARAQASELVGAAKDSASSAAGSTLEAAKEAAPDELAARMEREDQSAKGPLEALAGAVKGAAGYVKQHMLHAGGGGGSPAPGSPRGEEEKEAEIEVVRLHTRPRAGWSGAAPRPKAPHEYAALPGDIHPAQLAKIVREKVLHVPEAAPSAGEVQDTTVGAMREAGKSMEKSARTAADKAGATLGDAKGAVSSAADRAGASLESAKGRAEGAYEEAAGRAGEAYEQARGAVSGANGRAGDAAAEARSAAGAKLEQAKASAEGTAEEASQRSSDLLGAARDKVAGAVHTVEDTAQAAEDKAKLTYQHTKEEIQAGQEHWREVTVPHTQEEALKAAGVVPSDTESLLRAKGLAAHEEHAVRSGPPQVVPEAEGATSKGAAPAGGSAMGRMSAGAKKAAHELKEAVHDLDREEPGDEGEIPS